MNYLKNIRHLFVYFDQKHIVGIDVKAIPLDAKGLITIRYDTILRDYGQGTYRLRKINLTQSIDICIDENTRRYIRFGFSNPEEITICRFELLKLLYENQEKRIENKYSLQSIHNIRTIFRYREHGQFDNVPGIIIVNPKD